MCGMFYNAFFISLIFKGTHALEMILKEKGNYSRAMEVEGPSI